MQLWNVLGLPSCGQVFLDDWNELRPDVVSDVNDSMVKGRPCEIQIMSWEGCRSSDVSADNFDNTIMASQAKFP